MEKQKTGIEAAFKGLTDAIITRAKIDARVDRAVKQLLARKTYDCTPVQLGTARDFARQIREQFSEVELRNIYRERLNREAMHGTKRAFFRWSHRMQVVQVFHSAEQFARVAGIKAGLTDFDLSQLYWDNKIEHKEW